MPGKMRNMTHGENDGPKRRKGNTWTRKRKPAANRTSATSLTWWKTQWETWKSNLRQANRTCYPGCLPQMWWSGHQRQTLHQTGHCWIIPSHLPTIHWRTIRTQLCFLEQRNMRCNDNNLCTGIMNGHSVYKIVTIILSSIK